MGPRSRLGQKENLPNSELARALGRADDADKIMRRKDAQCSLMELP